MKTFLITIILCMVSVTNAADKKTLRGHDHICSNDYPSIAIVFDVTDRRSEIDKTNATNTIKDVLAVARPGQMIDLYMMHANTENLNLVFTDCRPLPCPEGFWDALNSDRRCQNNMVRERLKHMPDRMETAISSYKNDEPGEQWSPTLEVLSVLSTHYREPGATIIFVGDGIHNTSYAPYSMKAKISIKNKKTWKNVENTLEIMGFSTNLTNIKVAFASTGRAFFTSKRHQGKMLSINELGDLKDFWKYHMAQGGSELLGFSTLFQAHWIK